MANILGETDLPVKVFDEENFVWNLEIKFLKKFLHWIKMNLSFCFCII